VTRPGGHSRVDHGLVAGDTVRHAARSGDEPMINSR
jgi:hypothetical protein